MGFRDNYDRFIEPLLSREDKDEIANAREEFWRIAGKVHGDEPFYESRLHAFFDWYLLDRKVNGKTLIERQVTGRSNSGDDRDMSDGLWKNIHGIFIVKNMTQSGGMKVKDIYTKKSYFIERDEGLVGFYRNALFEGRIIPYKGRFYLAPAVCFHPLESLKTIRHVFRFFKKNGGTDILPLIHRLSSMSLKWETYRNIKIKDIYRFDDFPAKRWWWPF